MEVKRGLKVSNRGQNWSKVVIRGLRGPNEGQRGLFKGFKEGSKGVYRCLKGSKGINRGLKAQIEVKRGPKGSNRD